MKLKDIHRRTYKEIESTTPIKEGDVIVWLDPCGKPYYLCEVIKIDVFGEVTATCLDHIRSEHVNKTYTHEKRRLAIQKGCCIIVQNYENIVHKNYTI